MRARGVLIGVSAAVLAACGADPGGASTSPTSAPGGAASSAPVTEPPITTVPPTIVPLTTGVPTTVDDVLVDRPYRLVLPSLLGPEPAPVVVLLHGYSGTAAQFAAEVGLQAEADRRGIVTVLPDGEADRLGNQFWNATEACCDFWQRGTADSDYLAAVIRDVVATQPVDPERVLVIGHSNGGFMAYRLACEHADLVSGIASLAGAMFLDPARCAPSRPVDVVQVHGTLDAVVGYDGGQLLGGAPHPGARESAQMWAVSNGCSTADLVAVPGVLDVDGTVPGAESTLATVAGCPAGGTVAVVTAEGGGHFPWGGADLVPTLLDVLLEPNAR